MTVRRRLTAITLSSVFWGMVLCIPVSSTCAQESPAKVAQQNQTLIV